MYLDTLFFFFSIFFRFFLDFWDFFFSFISTEEDAEAEKPLTLVSSKVPLLFLPSARISNLTGGAKSTGRVDPFGGRQCKK